MFEGTLGRVTTALIISVHFSLAVYFFWTFCSRYELMACIREAISFMVMP